MESRDSSGDSFLRVSVSKVSGLVPISKATSLRHKPRPEYCNDNFINSMCFMSVVSAGMKQPK